MLLTSAVLVLLSAATAWGACGVRDQSRIVGGMSVVGQPYQWYVALTVPTRQAGVPVVACGGSLITEQHVLTAAHCYANSNGNSNWAKKYKLLYLLQNRCNQTDFVSDPQAQRVIVHEGYSSTTMKNDIALITLKKKTSLTRICLPNTRSVGSGQAEVIGFGALSERGGKTPCEIQQATINVFTRSQCLQTGIRPLVTNLQNIVCAGELQGGVDSCFGDSGGPLQSNTGGVYYIKGIVSFGNGCARKNLPGVYTDVGAYYDWIRRKTGLRRRQRNIWNISHLTQL